MRIADARTAAGCRTAVFASSQLPQVESPRRAGKVRDRWRMGRVIRISSYRRVWRSWERRGEQEALLRRPEAAAIDALRSRDFPPPAQLPQHAPWKYLDVRRSLRANLKRAQPVGLLRDCVPRGSLRVLDIGCGAGFFLFIARVHGYDGL